METLLDLPLTVTEKDISKTREFYDLQDVNRIKESLDIIEDWCKTQEHLVEATKYINRNLLERIFVLARGSIEGTKKKIDRLLTSRAMLPEFFINRSPSEFEAIWSTVNYIPLPKLLPGEQSRVMVTQFLTDKLDQFTILSYMRYCFLVGEFRLNFDYSPSERYIIDLKNVHIGVLSKVNPVVVKKAEIMCTEGYGTKIKGIHILNAPPFVNKLVFILKQALREKVASRLHVHETYDDLYKHIPKEILPADYGGDDQSCEKLAETWKDCFRSKEAQKIVDSLDKLVVDESKRSSVKFNEEYMGMPGSFRKLNVD